MNQATFSQAIAKLLDEYGEEIREEVMEAIPEVAKATADELKAASPKLTGEYAKDWKASPLTENRLTYSATVYNGKNYRLTHLLEYGHVKWIGGRNTGERVKAYPHIAKAEEKANEELVERITKKVGNL